MNANDACKHLIEKIQSALNLHAPEKVIIIPAKNIINEKWMTKGLLKSSQQCERLYKKAIKLHKTS